MITIGFPTPRHMQFLSDNLRPEDGREIMSASGLTQDESLQLCLESTPNCSMAFAGGDLVAFFGVQEVADREGVPWFLGTTLMAKHALSVHRYAVDTVLGWQRLFDVMWNYVYAENVAAHQWLERLGFDLYDPEPYGARGEMFRKFNWVRGG